MTITDILNQNKRGMGYFRAHWDGSAFIQMNYTSGIYTMYKVNDKELIKAPFYFKDEDIKANDWEVENLCKLESKLLALQEKNKAC